MTTNIQNTAIVSKPFTSIPYATVCTVANTVALMRRATLSTVSNVYFETIDPVKYEVEQLKEEIRRLKESMIDHSSNDVKKIDEWLGSDYDSTKIENSNGGF